MRHLALVKAVPDQAGGEGRETRSEPVREDMLKCSYHPPDADFYCWRFKIWYNTLDCAYRTKYQTFEGCTHCSQGDFNLQSRRREMQLTRYLGDGRT